MVAEREQWLAAAARDAIERQRQDAEAQAQLYEATTALANQRSAWAQERDNTAWQHQQTLDAARGALDQERQDFSARHYETQAALEAERQRGAALLADLQETRARAGELAAMQQAAGVDYAAMLKLRDDLLRFMADADSQCRTIIEHHEARLAPGTVVSNQSFT